MARRRKPNRGVVLLIVLTLLTLLVVVGLTFAVLSGQFRRAAEAAARKERFGDPPRKLLDRAMYQLVRDTNDPRSVARSHSLLRDIYGESLRGGQVGAATQIGGGQFVQFSAVYPTILPPAVPHTLKSSGFLNGCVLTYIDGPLKGISTRIVGYGYDIANARAVFRVMMPKREDGVIVAPANGNLFVINGRPFVGTGAGFDPVTGGLTQNVTIGGATFPYALLPNFVGVPPAQLTTNYQQGGLNESYDVADYQNMLLAAMVPNAANPATVQVLPSLHRPALTNYWINHASGMWDPNNPASPAPNRYREFRRSVVLRPMPWDHPDFDGGNPALAAPPAGPARWAVGPDGAPGVQNVDDNNAFGVDDNGELGWPGSDDVLQNDAAISSALVSGPWDVDSDGDGVRDSLWMDLGFPIQTDAEGRRYKPLFAILCIDMDGRLNLNDHGNLSHVASVPPTAQTIPVPVRLPTAAGPQLSTTLGIGRGGGYGTPEISLIPVLSSVGEYKQLLQGNLVRNIPGRYGANSLPGDNGVQTLALAKMFELPPPLPLASPTNYFLAATPLSAFSSPYDIRGELAFGLDYRGMPLYERPTQINTIANTAYELNRAEDAPRGPANTPVPDMPFTMAELERLLRTYDVDALGLPDRLHYVVDSFRTNPGLRNLVTTDSYDPPSPGIASWPELLATFQAMTAAGLDRPRHVLDLIKARLILTRALTVAQLNSPAVINRLDQDLAQLVSPEMVLGVRFDVNRPFGNGRDDPSPRTGSPNRVVDDPGIGTAAAARGEERSGETIWGGVPFDHDNDGIVPADPDAFRARHLYAKHLYVLMMAIKPNTVQLDFDGDPTNNTPAETAYGIAQWAVNVVDFRDADSVMTPFEFDIRPFNDTSSPGPPPAPPNPNGWDVDGIIGSGDDVSTERGLVWGCERPELLITEALAFHDRRTEDLTTPGGKVDPTGMDPNADPNFDQRLAPRGSFFLELYNPWAGDDRPPGEFYYNQTAGAWTPGVLLNQVTPGPGASPVWRVAIARGPNRDRDPDHWDATRRLPVAAIRRTIYFTPAPGPVAGTELPFFTNLPVAPVMPGHYAVIGSAGQSLDEGGNPLDLDGDGIRDYVTTIGRRTDAIEDGAGGLNYATTRRIVLEPNPNPLAHGAQVFANQAIPSEPAPPNIQPAVGVVINLPRSISVTEPVAGYPAAGPAGEVWDPTQADYEGMYTPALDNPFDTDTELVTDGTTNDYCTVHLQRLANPLLPYHAVLNPYLTIDSMSSDLTAFNGVTSVADPNAGNSPTFRFHSRERGFDPSGPGQRVLWKHESGPLEGGAPAPPAVAETTPLHHFGYVLGNSIGFLNRNYWPFYVAATAPAPTPFPAPLPNRPANFYVGAPATSGPPTPYGAPIASTFPWLTWINRPFKSVYELMQVPTTRSSQLPYQYDVNAPPGSPYSPGSPDRYGHLLNFFQTTTGPGPGSLGSNFYRLFELAHVPSRFVETDVYFNPTLFNGNATPGTQFFHPPFNHFSQFRDPGRINLNTILSPSVWSGLQAGHPGLNWPDFVSSRRGYGVTGPNVFVPNPEVPTFFANPFRAAGEAHLVPPTSPTNPANRLDRLGVEATLLRSDSIGYSGTPSTPRLENTSTATYDDTDRNPYFRYRSLARLGNLTTTRSNVYAVWITVGFFEVDPSPDASSPAGLVLHPDGFRLGKELGSDAGKVKRHRAFYMIDRTVPVAFEPGQNHNVDRAVRLRRFIE